MQTIWVSEMRALSDIFFFSLNFSLKHLNLNPKDECSHTEEQQWRHLCVSSENNKADVKLSELEPFTDYSCTGLILQNSISINKTTPSVHVRVDCGEFIFPLAHQNKSFYSHTVWSKGNAVHCYWCLLCSNRAYNNQHKQNFIQYFHWAQLENNQ